MAEKNLIKNKIAGFIKKYYKNQILRGSLLTIGFVILLFLLIVIPESFLYLSGTIRQILFFTFIVIVGFILFKWIIVPVLKLFNIRKGISDEEAARIIGKYFPEIDDKLLNLLQLQESSKNSQSDLLLASIAQKAEKLKPFNFKKSINYKVNLPLLRWVAPLVIILLIALLFFPGVFVSSAKRVVTYNTFYEKPLPYHIYLKNKDLKAIQNESFTFKASVEGDYLPDNLQLIVGNDSYQMKRNVNQYEFTLDNVSETTKFYFASDEVQSQMFTLEVYPFPVIYEFEMHLNYPNYTHKKSEVIKNSGDLIVPQGTSVSWKFYTKDVNHIDMIFPDSTYITKKENSNVLTFRKSIYKALDYKVLSSNEYITSKDTLSYRIQTIYDSKPEIAAKMFKDSINYFNRFFSGEISDDYGFSSLYFICKTKDSVILKERLKITDDTRQNFFYHKDFTFIKDYSDETVFTFYFQVFDNDRINGAKLAKSQRWTIKKPSFEEVAETLKEQQNEIKTGLEKQLEKSMKLGDELHKLKEKMLEKENLNWEERNTMLDLVDEFEAIKQQMEEIKKNLSSNRSFEDQLSESDKRLLEKQKQLEELMEEIMDDEMKKLMDEMRELMKEMNKDKFDSKLKDFEMSAEEMEEQIDRTLQLYKQLQFEKELDQSIKETKELKEKQLALEQKTKDDKAPSEEDKALQDKLNSKADSLNQHLKNLDKLNQSLEKKNDFKMPEQEMQDAKKSMQESSNEMKSGKMKKAHKKMKKAVDKLQDIENNLTMQMEGMQEENNSEDAAMLKQILENLIDLSFDQEALMKEFQQIQLNNPQYVPKIQDEFKIQNNLEYVSDSLKALANRQVMIKAHIMSTLKKIDRNISKSIDYLSNRNIKSGTRFQQEVMMDMNNLALILSESLEQMNKESQSQSSCSRPGSKSCNNPKQGGKGKPSMSELRKMQEEMLKQMKQMQNNPGGKKQSMSEQFARMAAKQSAIRRMMQQYREELMKQGGGDKGLSKTIEKMDKNEEDLVNKRITEDLLKRQQEIVTRMLQSEKAEKEQEKEKKRESEKVTDFEISNPSKIKFKQLIENNKELLNTVPSELTPFYKNKVLEYYKNK